jgi:hypothetical protein
MTSISAHSWNNFKTPWSSPSTDLPDRNRLPLAQSPDERTARITRLATRKETTFAAVSTVTKSQLLSLRHQGWTIAPNFHFGHMAKGFVWTTGDIGVDEYVSYWLAHIGAAGQIRREEWRKYFNRLIELSIASEADRKDFDRDFTQTKRSSATPRPGLRVERSLPFESAAQLDRAHLFGRMVHDSINTVLDALEEPAL